MVIDPADENTRSVGSFFTNPVMSRSSFVRLQETWKSIGDGSDVPSFPTGDRVKVPAAWLVERSGFTQGFRKGRAGISAHHTLALVNRNGTTRELIELATEIESTVENTFGIRLYREPVVIPYTQEPH
jgi:UDP-N-acetylmuramate dehydrogenase